MLALRTAAHRPNAADVANAWTANGSDAPAALVRSVLHEPDANALRRIVRRTRATSWLKRPFVVRPDDPRAGELCHALAAGRRVVGPTGGAYLICEPNRGAGGSCT
jgi:hypothetical protein